MLYACKDEYEAPMFLADASWLISETNNVRINEGIYVINEGHWISFADLSQGTLSHTWTISDGTQFMKTGFGKDEEDYSQFVIPNSGNVSEDAKIHVYFGDAGERTVRLYNTFPDSVAFTSTGTYKNNGELEYPGDTLVSHKVGDEWVIDTTFVVDVYADVQPEFYIYKALESGDSLVYHLKAGEIYTIEDSLNFAQVNLEMGQELRVIDSTKFDRPDGREWAIDHGLKNPTKTEALDTLISFDSLDTLVMGSIKVFRIAPENIVSTLIPVIVNVGPSSESFKVNGEIYETSVKEDNSLSFTVSGSVGNIGANAVNAFTVNVDGVGAVDVSSVKTDRDNASVLVLSLSANIYNSDVITVAYQPTSEDQQILRQDTRVLEGFDAQTAVPYFTNLVYNTEIAGIEEAHTNTGAGAGADGWWVGATNDGGIYQRSTDRANTGEASMRYNSDMADDPDAIGNIILQGSKLLQGLPTDISRYRVSIYIYLDAANTMQEFTSGPKGAIASTVWDIKDTPRGQWVKLSQDVDISADNISENRYDFVVKGNGAGQILYFDDFEIAPLYER